MTFHFTAMGALIVWCWLSVAASGVVSLASFVEGKPGKGFAYLAEGIVLVFLLLVR